MLTDLEDADLALYAARRLAVDDRELQKEFAGWGAFAAPVVISAEADLQEQAIVEFVGANMLRAISLARDEADERHAGWPGGARQLDCLRVAPMGGRSPARTRVGTTRALAGRPVRPGTPRAAWAVREELFCHWPAATCV